MEVSATQSQPPGAISDGLKLNQDFDQFLRLLTTQLQNQDPLEPMDSTEFTNQLVQFSGVEQSIKTNSLLQGLLSVQALNMTALGVSFIGKNVEVAGSDFQTDGTASSIKLSYSLPETPITGTITILDSKGETVFSKDVEKVAGLQEFTWDGLDQGGQPVAAGTYTLKVSALGEENAALNPTTYVPGFVSGLESAENGDLLLNINDKKVPLTEVRKISAGS